MFVLQFNAGRSLPCVADAIFTSREAEPEVLLIQESPDLGSLVQEDWTTVYLSLTNGRNAGFRQYTGATVAVKKKQGRTIQPLVLPSIYAAGAQLTEEGGGHTVEWIFISIYLLPPPSRTTTSALLHNMSAILNSLPSHISTYKLIMGGDFNIASSPWAPTYTNQQLCMCLSKMVSSWAAKLSLNCIIPANIGTCQQSGRHALTIGLTSASKLPASLLQVECISRVNHWPLLINCGFMVPHITKLAKSLSAHSISWPTYYRQLNLAICEQTTAPTSTLDCKMLLDCVTIAL